MFKGIFVMIEVEYMCMIMCGIKKLGSKMIIMVVCGLYKDD